MSGVLLMTSNSSVARSRPWMFLNVDLSMLKTNRDLKLENYSTDFEVKGEAFEVYTTSNSSNLRKSTSSVESVSIPKKSIVTLKAVLK